MLKTKRISMIIVSVSFFISFWLITNFYTINFINILSEKDMLLNLNNSVNGYVSLMAYAVFYPFLFSFLLYNFFYTESIERIIRIVTREKIYNVRFLHIILFSILFTFIHIGIHSILILYTCGIDILIESNFFLYLFLQFIVVTLFYIQVGILFYILLDLLGNYASALLGCFVFYTVMFFLHKIGLIKFKTSITDLVVLYYSLRNILSHKEILMIYLRQSIYIITLYLIGKLIFGRKDIIK